MVTAQNLDELFALCLMFYFLFHLRDFQMIHVGRRQKNRVCRSSFCFCFLVMTLYTCGEDFVLDPHVRGIQNRSKKNTI